MDDLIATLEELGERIRHLEALEFTQPVFGIYPTITGNTTLTALDYATNGDASGGAFSVFLPVDIAGETFGYEYVIKKIDATANAVTVDGNGVNIDGGATFPLSAQYDYIRVKRDLTQWWIIG